MTRPLLSPPITHGWGFGGGSPQRAQAREAEVDIDSAEGAEMPEPQQMEGPNRREMCQNRYKNGNRTIPTQRLATDENLRTSQPNCSKAPDRSKIDDTQLSAQNVGQTQVQNETQHLPDDTQINTEHPQQEKDNMTDKMQNTATSRP